MDYLQNMIDLVDKAILILDVQKMDKIRANVKKNKKLNLKITGKMYQQFYKARFPGITKYWDEAIREYNKFPKWLRNSQ